MDLYLDFSLHDMYVNITLKSNHILSMVVCMSSQFKSEFSAPTHSG